MKLRKVLKYISTGLVDWNRIPIVLIIMECGHSKRMVSGIYDENTKRMCKECK
jgi:hypothetical protein